MMQPKRRRKPVSRPVALPRDAADWQRGWQRTWKKLGFVPYELPADDSPTGQEREFPGGRAGRGPRVSGSSLQA